MPKKERKETKTDVLLVVQHKKVLKVRVRPFQIFLDEEKYCEEIAKAVQERVNCAVLVNESLTDMNKRPNLFEADAKNKKAFFDKIESINPKLIIDIHGIADVGPLFMNSFNEGFRYFRDMREKKAVGLRPQVDLEFRRKAGCPTCKGKIVLACAKAFAKEGLQVDFEAVYPGGYLIERASGMKRDAFAIEINRTTREEHFEKVVNALVNFIKIWRGERIEEEICEGNFVNTEVELERMREELERRRRQAANHPAARPLTDETYIG